MAYSFEFTKRRPNNVIIYAVYSMTSSNLCIQNDNYIDFIHLFEKYYNITYQMVYHPCIFLQLFV